MSEQKDTELNIEISQSEDNTDNNQAPEPETQPPSWQAERPNPEQQIPSWQNQQPYPGQQIPEQPYPGQQIPEQPYPGQTNAPWQNQQTVPGQQTPEQPYPRQTNAPWQNQQTVPGQQIPGQPYPGQTNAPWQNQQTVPGQQIPGQPYPGQTNTPWQNQQFPNVPPSGTGNFYPNQNPNFQNLNMQNRQDPNIPNQNMPNPNLSNPNFQGQQGMNKPPLNPMAVTSLVLGIISLLVSCCCFPVGFIVGFVLAMIGLVLSISSKKGKPFSGYAIAGLVLSILGICESLFLFLSYLITARMMQDPNISNLMNQIMEQYEKSLGPQMISSILKNLL